MTEELFDWMPNLATLMGTMSGIKRVFFQHPTDTNAWVPSTFKPGDLPAVVIELVTGGLTFGPGGIWLHRVKLTIFSAKTILAEADAELIPYIDLMASKLASKQYLGLPDRISHVGPDRNAASFYEGPGGVEFAKVSYEALRFNIEVKEKRSYTFVAA